MRKTLLSTLVASALVAGCSQTSDRVSENHLSSAEKAAQIWPELDIAVSKAPAVEKRVADILASMTVEQKVAQIIQPEIRSVTVEDMRRYGFGSYLNGGGSFPGDNKQATPDEWIALAEAMYQASVDDSLDGSTIPTMWGTDAVHGHNNVVGATLFPHNIGLGAAHNPQLMEQIANITAQEVMATGIDWVFAPTVAVVRDDRWGRTYESYSENPDIVKEYAAAVVQGLQGHANSDDFLGDERVISTVKHFVGDGGTVKGDDQGDNIATEQALFDIHAQGYVGGLTVGAQSVMASFNSWHGKKLHGHQYLLSDVLKDRMGFDGFVVGDWNGHGQIAGCTNDNCAQAINAGLDIYMVPSDWKALYENTLAQVKDGTINADRLDDAVRRILRVKVRAGLFDKPSPAARPLSGDKSLIGSEAHREVARQAVRESLVLLKNNNHLLPLSPDANILVAGDAADNIGKQSGGWTITWQGTNNSNADFPGGSSIYDGIATLAEAAGGKVSLSVEGSYTSKPDVAIVVFGEEPYAEGVGDRDSLVYQPEGKTDLALLQKLQEDGIPVVSVFISGRPMWVNPELNASDAFVAAWLPGSEGAAVADVLFGEQDFTGTLPFSWPATGSQIVNLNDDDYAPLLPYGYGLTYGETSTLPDNLDETLKVSAGNGDEVTLLSAGVSAPWTLWLSSGDQKKRVTAAAQSLGAVSYRTIDKEIQEDAISVRFDGETMASATLALAEDSAPVNLTDVLNLPQSGVEGLLTFSFAIEQAFTQPVSVSVGCRAGESCQHKYTLPAASPSDWQTLKVPLSCVAGSASLSALSTGFSLSTSGKGTISLADVHLRPATPDDEPVSCN